MTIPLATLDPPGLDVALQRARGEARASFRVAAGRTRIERLHQAGCLKLRFPRLPDAQAVLVNTAGGLAGGDRLAQTFTVADGAGLTVTTQACERVYRSLGETASVSTAATLGEHASFNWLPQETILFDGGRVRRSLDVRARETSRFLLCEGVVLGREAMGEDVRSGLLADRWRVRRDGQLVFADDLRIAGAPGRSPALLGDNRAFATILCQRPENAALLGPLRAILGVEGGASLVDGLLVARLLAPSGLDLRRRLVPALGCLASEPLPRLWSL